MESTGSTELTIRADELELAGTLSMPTAARGLVIFAHGSGSGRSSPRNRRVAAALQARGLGTLLFDLLTEDEERADALDAHLRFDIPLLARRLSSVLDWASRHPRTRGLPVGLFGASTGAAAALIAAALLTEAERPVSAVVSRGGRPDLAGAHLSRVRAPTLLIVGGADVQVLRLNEDARAGLRGPSELSIVPGATHLFEEPGALDEVARRAGDFFVQHLSTRASASALR